MTHRRFTASAKKGRKGFPNFIQYMFAVFTIAINPTTPLGRQLHTNCHHTSQQNNNMYPLCSTYTQTYMFFGCFSREIERIYLVPGELTKDATSTRRVLGLACNWHNMSTRVCKEGFMLFSVRKLGLHTCVCYICVVCAFNNGQQTEFLAGEQYSRRRLNGPLNSGWKVGGKRRGADGYCVKGGSSYAQTNRYWTTGNCLQTF